MPPQLPMGGGGPPLPAAPPAPPPAAPSRARGGGGGGKAIHLGVPQQPPQGAGLLIGMGAPPPGGGGGEGPSAPETPSASEQGGPPGAGGAQPGMDYPELHIDGLDDGSGLEDLPDEGHARIHYKVTAKGKHRGKDGKGKGKNKHHASLEIHHLTPEGNGGEKESEGDKIRKSARDFFQSEDQGPPGGPDQGPTSEMPG